MNLSNRSRLAIAAVTLGLLAAACGGDDSSSDSTTPAATTAAPPDRRADGDHRRRRRRDAVAVATTSLGDVLTSGGKTLYIFTPDDGATPTCVDACATAWPPLAADGAAVAGDGVEAEDLTTVARPDGSMQVAYYGWPLYFYANDAAPGDVTGQGVGGKWLVIGADGTPIES